MQHTKTASPATYPDWVPKAAYRYLSHTDSGASLRRIARQDRVAPSTILRQIRRIEAAREDPLVDQALTALGDLNAFIRLQKEPTNMSIHPGHLTVPTDAELAREARRVLRRLSESDAVLAVSGHMDMAVVLRMRGAMPVRTASLRRHFAQAFALKDWIRCTKKGRVHQYRITKVGRAALKRLLAEEEADRAAGLTDRYAAQHRDWGTRDVAEDGAKRRRMRVNLAESPLAQLARRKDKSGQPFLPEALVLAGERLREDFELAHMGPRVAQNWDRFLTGGARGGFAGGQGPCTGPEGARARVQAALADLGPGLGDVVLRCCCHLEGLEAAEKRMGWSARSGKIVLRIALQRLAQHYAHVHGSGAAMMG